MECETKLMRKEIHIAITITGIVTALLEWYVVDDEYFSRSIVMLTLLLNSYLHLLSEWIYYRQNNAVIASSQFLIIPYINIIVAQILSSYGFMFQLFESRGSLQFNISAVSLLVIPLSALSIMLTARYYQKRYTGFVLKRKLHGPVKFPLFFNTLTIVIIIIIAIEIEFIGLNSVLILLMYFIQVIAYLIRPMFKSEYDDTARRQYINSLSRSPSRRSDYTPPRQRTITPSRPSQRGERKKRRSISTAPSSGYRTVPTTSRKKKKEKKTRAVPTVSGNKKTSSKTAKSKNNKVSKPRNVAAVSDGIEIVTKPKAVKRRAKLDQNLLPSGNVSKDDLKCMICYTEFESKSMMTVTLCPLCKYPAHEEELNQWLFQSSHCPRCAKDMKGKLNKRLRVNEKDYAKMIGKL